MAAILYWTLISVFWGADRQKCIKSVETLDLAYSDQYLEIKTGLSLIWDYDLKMVPYTLPLHKGEF